MSTIAPCPVCAEREAALRRIGGYGTSDIDSDSDTLDAVDLSEQHRMLALAMGLRRRSVLHPEGVA